MKVLQINTWFRLGSTGKLVQSIFNYTTSSGVDSYVMFGRGKIRKDDKKTGKIFKNSSSFEAKANSLFSRLSGIMYGGCFFSTNKAIRIIKKIRPDIIHIHCTNSFIINNFRLFKYLGENNYKVVITLHAEYLFTGSCSHSFDCKQWLEGCNRCPRLKQATRSLLFDRTAVAWRRMNKALGYIDVKNRKIISVSNWLKEKAVLSRSFNGDNISIIGNGIDTDIFRYYSDDENVYSYLKDNYKKIVLFCTPNFSSSINDIKGGNYFLTLSKRFLSEKETIFLVVGGNKYNFDFSKFKNMRYMGNLLDQKKLAMLYSVSDAALMLSKQETYSLVTAESISCGTRVIGFRSGGPESIAIPSFSKFFDYGDLDSLCDELKKIKRDTKKKSLKNYSDTSMSERYLEIYKELMNS